MIYDVSVVGAGVCGTLIARELTKYKLKVCFVDKGPDAASGCSRANSGIVHAGFDALPGTLKAKLNVEGCSMMKELADELDVEYRPIPSLVVCMEEDDPTLLTQLLERGRQNGVPELEIIDKNRLRELEPNISDKAVSALYAKSAGVISPYELAIAAGENAVQNGADYYFNYEVKAISHSQGIYEISDGENTLHSRYIVFACGITCDFAAELCDDMDFEITPRKGEYMLFDKSVSSAVKNVLFPLPSKNGKGILVAPTADGNLLIGPNANISDKFDTSTTSKGLDEIHKNALRLLPSLPSLKNVITSFAGVRPTPSTHDFIIKPSKKYPCVLHVAGIESPGVAASPAIAKYAVDMLNDMGLELVENKDFCPCRKRVVRMRCLSDSQKEAVIKQNPSYGKIICRCETITEGEIVDAITRPMGATTVDGVKRRTRAGMGRCQGGFCMPRVTEIIARERGISLDKVTKFNNSSVILYGKTK